jgi:hypothetical protein
MPPGASRPWGKCTALFATTNGKFMEKRTPWTVRAMHLAPHHDGEPARGESRPNAEAAGGDAVARPVRTVGQVGRTTEAVLAALAAVPAEFARLVSDKTDDQLMRPAQDGGFGMVEILPHMRDWEVILGNRVERILDEDEPSLEEYDDSLWAIEHAYRDQDPRQALQEFTALRTALVARLETLRPEDWNRVGILAKHGRVTLHWLLDQFSNHDAKHVVQARDVLA